MELPKAKGNPLEEGGRRLGDKYKGMHSLPPFSVPWFHFLPVPWGCSSEVVADHERMAECGGH
jgi:hypothetical protein